MGRNLGEAGFRDHSSVHLLSLLQAVRGPEHSR